MPGEIILTSQPDWAKAVATNYKRKRPFTLNDDADLGVNPAEDTLFAMLKGAELTKTDLAGVVLKIGLAGWGARVVVLALADPEPVTKAALSLAGMAMSFVGVGSAFNVLTNRKPANVKVTASGFEISW